MDLHSAVVHWLNVRATRPSSVQLLTLHLQLESHDREFAISDLQNFTQTMIPAWAALVFRQPDTRERIHN